MPASRPGEDLVFLDACCLINLFASGRAEDILRALPYRFAVARYVAEEEVLEIGSDEAEPDAASEAGGASQARSRTALSPLLDSLIDQRVLTPVAVTTPDEQRELIRFAVDLDDGEARTCALAMTRGALVATDDKKAIRVLRTAVGKEAGSGDAPLPPHFRAAIRLGRARAGSRGRPHPDRPGDRPQRHLPPTEE